VTRPQGKSGFLTVNEVADQLRMSNMTVYRIIDNGQLPALRFGRSFRIRQSDLRDYIRRSEQA